MAVEPKRFVTKMKSKTTKKSNGGSVDKKVLVFGTFDGIHTGHIHFLYEAKKLTGNSGGFFVSVSSDQSTMYRKDHLPKKNASARVKDIKILNIANKVSVGDKVLGEWTVVKKVKPDIIAVGYDQNILKKELTYFQKLSKIPFRIVTISSFKPKKLHSSIIKIRNL